MAAVHPDISRTIAWLRWPLIIGIMTTHLSPGYYDTWVWRGLRPEWMHLAGMAIGDVVAYACAYLMFFISGYLFFINSDGAVKPTVSSPSMQRLRWWARKMHRRLWTIVLPYLAWNVIAIFNKWLVTLPAMRRLFPNRPPDNGIGWEELSHAFYNFGHGPWGIAMPLDYPLWYLCVLLLLCCAAPLIWLALRHLGAVAPVAVFVVGVVGWWPSFFTGIMAWQCVFYFIAGAYCALSLPIERWLRWPGMWVSVPLLIGLAWLYLSHPIDGWWQIASLCSALVILWAAYIMAVRWRVPMPAWLTASAFTLYALHDLIMEPSLSVAYRLVGGDEPWSMILYLIVGLLLVTALCTAFDATLRRWLPWLSRLLTGSR